MLAGGGLWCGEYGASAVVQVQRNGQTSKCECIERKPWRKRAGVMGITDMDMDSLLSRLTERYLHGYRELGS